MWKLLCVAMGVLLFSNSLSAQTITYPGANPGFCPAGSITLTASNPGPVSVVWEYSSTGAGPWTNLTTSPTYTASVAGYYRIGLAGSPIIYTDSLEVIAYPNPVASFTSSPANQCSNLPVQFANNSTGATSYNWNFGDPNSGPANISTIPNPSHTFIGTPGNTTQTFTISLTCTSANGCTNVFTASVTTRQIPDAKLLGDGYGIYDGKEFFKKCSNLPSDVFDFYNLSVTGATNTNYQIIWGDGSPDYNSATFPPPPFTLQHSYPVGTTMMKFIVTGQNGCKDTTDYYVFLGSNPAVGLGNPGNTAICTGSTLTFPITGTSANSPGTIYTVSFNDGSTALNYSHPAPSSVSHTFNTTSCGVTSQLYPNSFSASIQASNPCASSTASVVPIYVSQKSNPTFDIAPNDTVCVTNNVTFTNTTGSNSDISNGICTPGKSVWKITPSTGWTIVSGSLGNDFGIPNPGIWVSGSTMLTVNFNTPGNYDIRLLTGNATCGRDSIIKSICVSAAPIAAFDIDQTIGCAPFNVNTTNNSPVAFCGLNRYQWTVSYSSAAGCTPATSGYSFLNGTNANSVNPQFQFTNPGTYTIGLMTITPGLTCSSTVVTRIVTVRDKPNVTLNAFNTICQGQSISPSASTSCFINAATTYNWTFPTGTPSSSTSANPGSIFFNTPGTHLITLAVTNECGTTTITRSLIVNPVPAITVPAATSACAGEQVGPLTFMSTPAGATFTWTNSNPSIGLPASGTSNIPVFTATNAGASPVTATINVTGSNGFCPAQQSFTITVNPRPAAPLVATPVSYCLNETAVPLAATATGSNTLLWYTVATGGTGSATAPTPLTTAVATTPYYVSQVNPTTNCESPRALINVIVRAIPAIGTVTSINPTTCGAGNGSFTITGLAATVSHTVNYLSNAGPQTATITSTASGTITITGLGAGTYSNIYVTINGCSSAILGPVQLTNPAQPATPVVPAVPQMCSGGTLNLSASSVTPGVSYSWTGPNSFTSNQQNPSINNVTVAASGTYFVTATVNGCTSPAGSVSVVINPTAANPSASNNGPVCEGLPIALSASTSTGGTITWAWTGPNAYSSNSQNPVLTNPVSGIYTVIATATTNGQACPSASATTTVLVKPVPQIIDSSFTDPLQCGQSSGTIILQGLVTGTSYTVLYNFNTAPQSVTLTAAAGGVVSIINLAQGVYDNIRVVLNGCTSNIAGPFTLTDPTPPNTPVAVTNAPVCSGTTVTLSATTTSTGTATYSWTGPGAYTANIPNPTIPNATVANSGTYHVTVSIAGCASAPASVNVIVNQTPATPNAGSNSPVCTGNTLQLNSATATPGGMTYAWTGPNSFTSTLQNPVINNVTAAAAGAYTVIYTSTGQGGCVSASANTTVVVNTTPVLATAVPTDPSACGSASGFITLNGLNANQTYTVNYTFNALPQTGTITTNGTGSGVIPNLAQGTYNNIVVVLAGCTSNSLGPVNLTDPNPPTAPVASSNSAICSGQTLSLSAAATAPGVASYTWTGPNGFNSTAQNPGIPAAGASNAGYYYVYVTINNCNSLRDSVLVVINPLGALPGVSTPVTYCIGQPSVALTASTAAGGTLNWYNVPSGGTPLSSAPVPPTTVAGTTSWYVSQSTTAGCEGGRAQVDVVVNPDARAVFNPVNPIKCAPYIIGTADIGLQTFPANNSQYNWYADNVFIGAGSIFPGFTISQPDDSVTIKLVAISAFGCKNDSSQAKFYTFKIPSPSFDLSDSVGCGPLTVVFTNTTPDISQYNYYWDFGNGQTSAAQQPGAIVFPINPTYNDSVYTIKLKIETQCDTVTFTRYVRVKAPPRALFIPDRTTGCSPMRVVFTNTSLGLNSTYYWDFGDGSPAVTTTSPTPVSHIYNSGIVDTFTVRLIAVNECGSDTQHFDIRIAPNNINLNFNINGPQNFGCAPHTVAFINNSSGASSFEWSFGDGNTLSTTNNIDTVYHTFANAGIYNVTLTAINSCTDTTATRVITVYPKPTAAFTSNNFTVCIGQAVQLTNQSLNANTYAWNFGDGGTSVLVHPTHTYNTPGLFSIRLISYRNNPSGDVCIDTAYQQILVRDTLPGFFTMSDSTRDCAPLTVTFVNRVRPSVTASWNFGDGNTAQGDSVLHTYTLPGIYYVDLIVTVPGGCTYKTMDTVTINGPSGTLQYNGGYVCLPDAVLFTANAFNASSYVWNFGDGNTATTTTNTTTHVYANPGNYIPSVSLQNPGGCNFPVQGLDTIKADRVVAGFRYSMQQRCGTTTVLFTDTSSAFFGITNTAWDFGNGNTGTGISVSYSYTISGLYNIEMRVTSASGCTKTVIIPVNVLVNSIPEASIIADAEKCANQTVVFSANVVSNDPLGIQQWTISNGVTATGPSFSYLFNLPGTYNVRYIAGTAAGCFDTAFHSIVIRPVPVVNSTASTTICLGNSVQLNATGAPAYQWNPSTGLSCNSCPNPVATPSVTTPYIVTGTNAFGCAAYDTTVITVIQPMNLVASPDINICIGQSANLMASGAATYAWTPAATLNSATISNPVATPTATTTYRVIGYDGHNCFTDTAFVLVGVGQYPTVNLGPDLTLSTGTLHPLISTITNGPIAQWLWQPATDLNCNTCPQPLATIKKDITYAVRVTTAFGCSATDTINIKTFCENSQVFIPNAFTPDGDGINDILMVRGKGIVSVKFFRIFNRWGEVVFERTGFPPNVANYGWNGKIRGVTGGPDVFVYTAEVVCENGTTFVYKGNTSIIK